MFENQYKKHMKSNLLILAAALLALAGCQGKVETDPVTAALKEKITKVMEGDVKSIKITGLEKIDSTTYAQELERKKKVFELKFSQCEKAFNIYNRQGMFAEAQGKVKDMQSARNISKGLLTIEEAIKDSINNVIYYDYKFAVDATGAETELKLDEAYAAITPAGEVLNMGQSQGSIHKSLGYLIPGYSSLVRTGVVDFSAEALQVEE